MKKLLLALTLLLSAPPAWAQCTGQFPPNTVCGNNTGAASFARPIATSLITSSVNSITAYSGVGDEKHVTDGAINSTSQTLTSATAGFTNADVNKAIIVYAGPRAVSAGTYISGGSVTGAAGTWCNVAFTGGGGSGATGYVTLTGANTIAGSTALAINALGTGFTSAPTSATLSNGTGYQGATCSGTATVATTLIALPYITTITAFTNSTTVTVGVAATTTVTGANVYYGTDNCNPINTAITATDGIGGGTLYFPQGTYLSTCQLTTPGVASAPAVVYPQRNPITLAGADAGLNSDLNQSPSAIASATTLDLVYNGTNAKMLFQSSGRVEVTGFTITDHASSSLPFVYTTGKSLYFHDNFFAGNPFKTGMSADQDVFIFGGTSDTDRTNPTTGAFQGYGTVITRNNFSTVRTLARYRRFANAIVFSDNTSDVLCGGDASHPVFFLDAGTAGNGGDGNYFMRNTIEVLNYVYVVGGTAGTENTFVGNGYFDNSNTGPRTLIALYHAPNANISNNTFYGGYAEASLKPSNDVFNGTPNRIILNDDGNLISYQGVDPWQDTLGLSKIVSNQADTAPWTASNGSFLISNEANSANAWAGMSMVTEGDNTLTGGIAFSYDTIANHSGYWTIANRNNDATIGLLQYKNKLLSLTQSVGIQALGGYVQPGNVTVANLPTCNAGLIGAHIFVVDQATAVAYRGAVTGGGGTKQNVLCDGTNWLQD